MPVVKPAPRQLLVARSSSETESPGGIILPDSAQKKATQGTILAVYESFFDPEFGIDIEPRYKEGDTVLFKKYSGEEFEISGKKLLFMDEKEILGTIV